LGFEVWRKDEPRRSRFCGFAELYGKDAPGRKRFLGIRGVFICAIKVGCGIMSTNNEEP
jgi:hypothetical protein